MFMNKYMKIYSKVYINDEMNQLKNKWIRFHLLAKILILYKKESYLAIIIKLTKFYNNNPKLIKY